VNTIANHKKRLLPMAAALLLTAGLSGCADEGGLGGDTGGTTAGTTGGTTSGTTAGTTGGTTAGTTAGTTGGTTSGTTAGTTGGTTAGTTAGTTGGTTSGTTAGTTGGTTAGTTAGTTGGTTSGTTAGTTGGTTAGTTAGTTGGTTAGTTGGTSTGGDTTGGSTGGSSGGSSGGTTGDVVAGIICNPTSDTFRPILLPDASVSSQTNGLCIGCSVNAPDNVIDGDPTTVADLTTPIGLLTGSSQLNVINTLETYPAGRRAGFTLFDPAGALLTLNLLQSVRISAALNGTEVDSATVPTGIALDLLGTTIVGTTDPQFLSFVPTASFNELRISFGGNLANVLAQIGIIQACVSVNDAVLP
jgi:hypothetical protein